MSDLEELRKLQREGRLPYTWVRAALTDPLYKRMSANPDEKIPFQVNFAFISRLDPVTPPVTVPW